MYNYDNNNKSSKYEILEKLLQEIKYGFINDIDKTNEMKEVKKILEEIKTKFSLEDYFENSEEDINFFIETFLSEIISNILAKSYVAGNNGDDIALDILYQIYLLFEKFHDKNYSKVFEKIRQIFNEKNNFYHPDSKSKNINQKKSYSLNEFRINFGLDLIDLMPNRPKILFKVDDIVDILVKHYNSQSQIDYNVWLRGKIKRIGEGRYYIEYNGEKTEITFPIGSANIQPFGTKTNDWDWRTNLKKYSLIDVYDRDKWWPATVYEVVEEINKFELKRVKYKIGFRLYTKHFNNPKNPNDSFSNYTSFWENNDVKLDENKEEFIGDGKDSDIELYHFSSRIQEFYSYSEIQKMSIEEKDEFIIENVKEELIKNIEKQEDDNLYDDYDSYEKYYENSLIKGKSENFSYYYALLLKKIAEGKGFDIYLGFLKEKPSKEELLTIFTILLNSFDYIIPHYFEENKEIFKNAFFEFIKNLNDEEIENISNNLIELSSNFLKKLYPNIHEESIEEEITLNISFKFIKTSLFEKRLKGIELLSKYINSNNTNEKVELRIIDFINNNNIINEIFLSDNNSKIILKSYGIIKILLKYHKLSAEDRKIILGCIQRDDLKVKTAFIELMAKLVPDFDNNFLGFLMDALLSNKKEKYNDSENDNYKEVNLALKISSVEINTDIKNKIIEYLCQNLFCLNNYKINHNFAFKKLCELMNKDENYIKKVLDICENNLKNNKNSLICYEILKFLISNFIKENSNDNLPYLCEIKCLNNFLKEEHLMKIYEENFTNYIKILKERNSSQSKKEIDTIVNDGFSHYENINKRLNFLEILSNKIYPYYNFLPKIKELLLDKPSTSSDKSILYKFITNFFSLESKNKIKNEIKEYLFEIFKKIDQTKMTFEQFKILLEIFLSLNSSKLKYKIENKNEEYEVNVEPKDFSEDIFGIDFLWEIIFQIEDEKIVKKLVKVLYQIIPEEEIIEKLEKEEANEKKYILLKLFLIESEKKNIIDFKSHYSLLKNCIIKFPLEIEGEKNNENIFEFFYDNTSLNDIKEELSKKYKIPMNYIEAYYKNNKEKLKLDYTYNNKTLKEMILDNLNKNGRKNNKIEFKKILSFSKNRQKENLLIERELSPKFKNILSSWFKRFSENTGKMDIKMFANFILSVDKDNTKNGIDDQIKLIFNKYDKNKRGYIIEEDFFKYYSDLLLGENKFDYCFENLKNMGYNEYLIKKDESLNVLHLENEKSWRFLMSNDIDILNDFNKIYNDSGSKINYNYIFFLSTNINIYNYLLYNFNKDKKALEHLLGDDKNMLSLLYYLIIIESFIQDIELQFINYKKIFKNNLNSLQIFCTKKYEPFDNIDIQDKNKFLEDFIKNNNYIKLVNYFKTIITDSNGNINGLLKEICLKVLKIIIIIYRACVGVKKLDDFPIDDNIYYLDYSHLGKILENKNELKDIVLKYDYSNYMEKLIDYLNCNGEDEIYNKCFDSLIDLLAFSEEINKEMFKAKKNHLLPLIESIFKSNNSYCINKLFNTLKELTLNLSLIQNQFFEILGDIIIYLFDFFKETTNYIFFEFLKQIIDCLDIINISYEGEYKNITNMSLEKLLESLINDIKQKNEKKKMPKEMFIIFMELINNLIKKYPKTKDDTNLQNYKKSLYETIINIKIKITFPTNIIKIDSNYNFDYFEESLSSWKKYVNLEDENEKKLNILNEQINNLFTNYIILYLEELNKNEALNEIKSIKNYIKENSKNYNQEENDNFNDKNEKNNKNKSLKICGHVGLKNLGSTCYINAIIQQLYMIPTLRYAVMGADDHDITLYSIKFSPNDDNLLHQLQVMFTYLTISNKQYYNPKHFFKALKDFEGNPIDIKNQQDSLEIYNDFCEQIVESLKKTKYKYIIKDVLVGKTCTSIQCESCHYISNKFEDFYSLTLEVKDIKNLDDSLKKLIEPEIIKDFKCDNCEKKVDIQKRTTLAKLPNILVIYLKRFFKNYDYGYIDKLNSKFEFPTSLNLNKYCIENFQSEDNKFSEIYSKKEDYYEYVLKGINIHVDSENHYISLIDVNRGGNKNTMCTLKGNEKSEWVKFDDVNLSEFDINDIPKECFGGKSKTNSSDTSENLSNAYLLIYERIKKNPIKLVIEQGQIKNNKDYIEYSMEKENCEIKYDISWSDCEINEEELYQLIFYNKDIDEYFRYIPYYSIPKVTPKIIYDKVMSKNVVKKRNNSKIEDTFKKELNKNLNNFLLSNYDLSNEIINLINANNKITLINIKMNDIFKKAKKDSFTYKEKKEINEKMNSVINIIKSLIKRDKTEKVLKNIINIFLSRDIFLLIFNLGKQPIFDNKIVELIYYIIIDIFDTFKKINNLDDSLIFMILENLIKCIKDFKTSQNYNGTDEKSIIKYIYKLFIFIVSVNIKAKEKSVKEKMISVLLTGITKEYHENQMIIFDIIEILMKITKEYYNENLFYFDQKEKEKYKNIILEDKLKIMELMKYDIIQLMFNMKNDLLVILIKILSSLYQYFNNKLIYCYLPNLLKFSLENNKFNEYVNFCYNLFDMKDVQCISRLKMILGYPTLIIKPITASCGNKKNIDQKWPLFGSELIKYNNNDLKTQIYKYISFKKKFCILSYILPYDTELKEEKIKYNITDDNIKKLIFQLISKCFSNGGNYNLFKYLYMLPARSLYYRNVYEELIDMIKDNTNYKFTNVEDIKKKNYIRNIQNKNKNNFGFYPDIIPGEIIREEFELLVRTEYLDLIRIEYFTKYYTLNELKKYIKENTENKEKKLLNKKNDKNINKDNKENVLKFDISNTNYQIEENVKISKINKRLNNLNKVIIEDGMIENGNKGIYSLVRYIFINKKSLKNRIEVKLKFKNIFNKERYPYYIIDYVDQYNYADFFDIIRFKIDKTILKKNDIQMIIESKYEPENYN